MDSIRRALVSTLNSDNNNNDHSAIFDAKVPAGDTPTASFVSRILQVALGLFVTTTELPVPGPHLRANPGLGFDCDFSAPCRWSSMGGTAERWKLARGEPDSILWLAATGTMVQPVEPFALLEVREGRPADMLGSELINNCPQSGSASSSSLFSFTYWTIGGADLEICLLDAQQRRFNCTGMLQAQVQPGKVALQIPPVERSFHIAIIPNRSQGVLAVDEIKYDARYCAHTTSTTTTTASTWETRSSSPSSDPSPSSFLPLTRLWSSSTTPWPPSSPPAFISPTPSPATGPHSTASPLPNPFTAGPVLPMGPLILPPFLPGPPSGIVNPFVVAPLIPDTSTVPMFSTPNIVEITAPPSLASSTPTVTTTTTMEIEMPNVGAATTDISSTDPNPMTTALFSSTVILPRKSKIKITHGATTTMVPWEITGMPNIPAFSTTTLEPLASFDLLVVGSKTRPFFDRRLGRITDQTDDLLCDFTHNFPCLWGPESGRWAVVQEGAIPSLDAELDSEEDETPQYPAAIVIQGPAMLSSDPLRCQSSEGKLLFRYWTNGRVLIQVCAIGWAVDSPRIQCVEEVAQHNRMDPSSLAVFDLSEPIREPFTLNVVPIWDQKAHNQYLIIDEIAYIGECNLTALNEIDQEEEQEERTGQRGRIKVGIPWAHTSTIGFSPFTPIFPPKIETKIYSSTTTISSTPMTTTNQHSTITTKRHPRPRPQTRRLIPLNTTTTTTTTVTTFSSTVHPVLTKTTTVEPPFWLSSKRPGTRYPFYPSTLTPPHHPHHRTRPTPPPTTLDPLELIITSTREAWKTTTSSASGEEDGSGVTTIYPGIAPLKKKTTKAPNTKGSFTIPYTTTQKYGPTHPPFEQNYCKLLNCDFNENACHYLNHGLTKVPWTLRTRGYGFPLNKNTDLRPTSTNGQFVSTVLGPGDFAILESPRFNLTEGINVLLFQYFRPTHSSTIRLCLGTRYTKPLRTVAAFLQCPPILRSITSKHSPAKWNSVHIQLPPGTSHFYLVAHNLDRSMDKTAIGIDNIRVAICDPRASFDPEDPDYVELGGERLAVQSTPAPPAPDSNELYVDLPERHRR